MKSLLMRRSDNKLPVFKKGISRALILALFALVFSNVTVLAQTHPVTGKIVANENGGSLAGVTVKVKGSNASAITAADGSFTINAAPNATLIISSVGYSSQEIPLRNLSTVSVRLIADAQALQQVVVVGYGTVKRKDLTGSISSISAETISQVPVVAVDQALQGRAAGVQVTSNDASPGGNITVLIRGTGSLNTNGNSPLYVVDGYPLETGGINNINPTDIASIDVLKDASATAIYGVRAANGVVMVTTKRGRRNGLQVTVDGYDAFQSRQKRYDVLNANQFATLANKVAAASGGNFQTFSAWSNPATLHNVDWQNALFQHALTQSYTVALRGGSDKVQSSTSLGFYNQKGIVVGSYFKRLTLSTSLDYQPTTWLRSATNIKYTRQDGNVPFGGNGSNNLLQLSELPPTLDSGNAKTTQISDGKGNYGFFNPIYTYVAKYGNPLYGIKTNRYSNINNFFLINTSLEATLLPGLKFKTNAGITYQGSAGFYFSPEDDRLVNQYGSQAGATQNGFYNQYVNSSFDWLWENTLSYDKSFGDHNLSLVAGYSAQKNDYNSMAGSDVPPNVQVQDLSQVQPGTTAIFTSGANGQRISSLESQFGRLAYNYAGKYYITGTVRRDGSSLFDQGHQYGVFPSGAVSWKLKEESFLNDVEWLSDLKLRGSWGQVGNNGGINAFQYAALFATGTGGNTSADNGYTFGNPKVFNTGTYPVQPAYPGLKWETDVQTDIGMDASFMHGHLNLTADCFNRTSKDFLLTLPAPAQSGYLILTQNVGSADNRGLEIALNYQHDVNSDFHYGVNLTFTTASNKLTGLPLNQQIINDFGNPTTNIPADGWNPFSQSKIGGPIGEFYGLKSIGIFQSQAQIDALNAKAVTAGFSAYQKVITQPGDREFADVNKDGTVNAADNVALGSPIPKFFGGLNL